MLCGAGPEQLKQLSLKQAGRYRQFNQMGVENVGVSSPYSDAETITLGYNSLKMIGFSHVILKINSIGDEESRNAYKEALKEYFSSKIDTMCPDCQRKIRRKLRTN